MSIYLDYNASAPMVQEVLELVIKIMSTQIGNADSRTHDFGLASKQIVKTARDQVAQLFAAQPREVIFTSGATESNNLVIQGLRKYGLKQKKKHIITSTIEHKSVLESVKALSQEGFDVDFVSPDQSGRVETEKILELIRPDTLLVTLMHVNNETGIIQPVDEIGKELKERGILFLVDATQSAGKLVEELRSLDYDFLTFSGHKLQGPQGIGGLIIKKDQILEPLMYGGHQERGIRPGTTPVALVGGLGKACEIAAQSHQKNREKLKTMKQEVLKSLDSSGVQYQLNGDQAFCVDNMISISFNEVSSEALMIMLKGVCAISNGSACTSDEYALSYVLKAMNLPEEQILDSVRISWGTDTNQEELISAIQKICSIVNQLQ